MTAAKLVKERLPGDRYKTSGSIEGLVEGRRTIRELRIRNAEGSLEALGALSSLEAVAIEGAHSLELGSLAALPPTCRRVSLGRLNDSDLSALRLPSGVTDLSFSDCADSCSVNGPLHLPTTLRVLEISATTHRGSARVVAALTAAIEWSEISDLEILDLRVDTTVADFPAAVDFGFLSHLQRLQRLFAVPGIRHLEAAGPSPLDPPFERLPTSIEWLRYSAEDHQELQDRLIAYLKPKMSVSIEPAHALPDASDQVWWIDRPDDSDFWLSTGSLASHFADRDFREEMQGLRHARALLKQSDPALLKRLDFDPDSDSTMFMAKTREDMVDALTILGIRAPNLHEGA